jgi:hypothetical protein
MKICSKCNRSLENKCFYKNSQSFDGLRPSCIECDKNIRKLWRDNNRERIKLVTTEYRKNNLEYYSKKMVQINKKRRQNNDSFKLEHNYRGLISNALKNNYKKTKATELLGCSIDFYKKFIESKFRNGMTWDNRGKLWDIDHINPLKNFDCSNYDQAKQAFYYKNTQVLLKEEHKLKTLCGK